MPLSSLVARPRLASWYSSLVTRLVNGDSMFLQHNPITPISHTKYRQYNDRVFRHDAEYPGAI